MKSFGSWKVHGGVLKSQARPQSPPKILVRERKTGTDERTLTWSKTVSNAHRVDI